MSAGMVAINGRPSVVDFTQISVEQFSDFLFSSSDRPAWHDVVGENWQTPTAILRLSIQLFQTSDRLPLHYSAGQLQSGFRFFQSSFFSTPADRRTEQRLRVGFYLSMKELFRKLFIQEYLNSQIALNWFEMTLVWGQNFRGENVGDDPTLWRAMLRALEGISRIPSSICQQAALHGFNHLHSLEADATDRMIRRFISSGVAVNDEIVKYANNCLGGRQR